MKFTLELDSAEMDEFTRIFFNGVTVPMHGASAIEKKVTDKVVEFIQKFEDSLV